MKSASNAIRDLEIFNKLAETKVEKVIKANERKVFSYRIYLSSAKCIKGYNVFIKSLSLPF